jgi:hypothetical protein
MPGCEGTSDPDIGCIGSRHIGSRISFLRRAGRNLVGRVLATLTASSLRGALVAVGVVAAVGLAAPSGAGAASFANLLRSAAKAADTNYSASPLTWSGGVSVDTSAPYGVYYAINQLSCPSDSLCVGVINAPTAGYIVASTDPTAASASAWSTLPTASLAPSGSGYVLSGVSCVTAGSQPLCLVLDSDDAGDGTLLVSADPAGSSAADWSSTSLLYADGAPSCGVSGSAVMCIISAKTASGAPAVYVSTAPTAGASGWTLVPLNNLAVDDSVTGAACATASFCAATATDGKFVESTNPANAASWSVSTDTGIDADVDTSLGVTLECPTITFCIATGSDDRADQYMATTTDPEDGATSSWQISEPSVLQARWTPPTCQRDTSVGSGVLCEVNVGWDSSLKKGAVAVSTDEGSIWSMEPIDSDVVGEANGGVGAFACPDSGLCIAGDETTGGVVYSINADTGDGTWSGAAGVAPGYNVVQIPQQSCNSASLCVGFDDAGRILTSTDPAGGGSTWSAYSVESGDHQIEAVACPSVSLCVATDNAGNVLTSTDPGGGGPTWTSVSVGDGDLTQLQCPSTTLCVASDVAFDNIYTSTNPAGGQSAWSSDQFNYDADGYSSWLDDMVCPSTSLCVALGQTSLGTTDLLMSTDPAGGSGTWYATSIGNGDSLYDLTCPSASFCAAASSTDFWVSTDPAQGVSSWSSSSTPESISFLQCPLTLLCVEMNGSGEVSTLVGPGSSGSTWSAPVQTALTAPDFLSCPTSSLCVAADGSDVEASIDPAAGGATWSAAAQADVGGFNDASYLSSGTSADIACPTASTCVMGDAFGGITTGTIAGGGPGLGSGSGSGSTGGNGSGSNGSGGGTTTNPGGSNPASGSSSGTGKAVKASTSGTTASETVRCAGATGQSCKLTVTLSVVETVRGGTVVGVAARVGKKTKKKTVVIGSKTVTVGAGKSKAVKITLNAAGKKLLQKRGKLVVSLTVRQSGRSIRSQKLTFKKPHPRSVSRKRRTRLS